VQKVQEETIVVAHRAAFMARGPHALTGEFLDREVALDLRPADWSSYTAAVNFDPTVLNVVLIVPASVFIAAVAPSAINAATNAYSIRS
jgi:hypothetical protein